MPTNDSFPFFCYSEVIADHVKLQDAKIKVQKTVISSCMHDKLSIKEIKDQISFMRATK